VNSHWALLVVDMQHIFLDSSWPWHVAEGATLIPAIERLLPAFPGRVIGLQFVPDTRAIRTGDGPWARYYLEDWPDVPRNPDHPAWGVALRLPRGTPVLAKTGYSAFSASGLLPLLRLWQITHLAVVGVETDVCILATVLAAVDLSFYTVVVTDAVASSNLAGHARTLDVFARLRPHVATRRVADLLSETPGGKP
jgi:nicotinamidase-related amidase